MSHGSSSVPPAAAGEHPSELATLTVPPRFHGPAGSANGGYLCGRLAGYLDGEATVTLRRPPPLATPMTVEAGDDRTVRLRHAGTVVAEATPASDEPAPRVPGTVWASEARAAEGRARYYEDPMFPGCFVCGPQRPPGDGLRIFPGPVPDRALWAAPWIPDASLAPGGWIPDASLAPGGWSVPPEFIWAALDCPGGIAAAEAADIGEDTAILLGRMTASVAVPPTVGEEYRVIAWPIGRDGRKLTAGSALLGQGDQVLAVARTVWLTVPRPVPGMAGEQAP